MGTWVGYGLDLNTVAPVTLALSNIDGVRGYLYPGYFGFVLYSGRLLSIFIYVSGKLVNPLYTSLWEVGRIIIGAF